MSQNKIREEVKAELDQFMKQHSFENLEAVMKIPEEKLMLMEGFGVRLLVELHRLKDANASAPDSTN
jgi:hypothetical protein